MEPRSTADLCFNIPEIIALIAIFISLGSSDCDSKTSYLSQLSRTNRCSYLTLSYERSHEVAYPVKHTPSLLLFLDGQLQRSKRLSCRSLDVIGDKYFSVDKREKDAHSALVDLLTLICEHQTLDTFAYHSIDDSDERDFLCVPPQIWDALKSSTRTIRSLNTMAHPCNWAALFNVEFPEVRNLQLALSFIDELPGCKLGGLSPATLLLSSNALKFLQNMQHLTHLVLSIQYFKAGQLNVSNLHFPELQSIDITAHVAPLGLTRFVSSHTQLQRLHLSFGESFVPGPFQDHDLPELRALKLDSANTRTFAAFLARRRSEDAETTMARRPRLEHLRIRNVRMFSTYLQYVNDYVQPFGRQLRRLDLHFSNRKVIFSKAFLDFLRSFVVLDELSIELGDDDPISGPNDKVLSIAELRDFLAALKDCIPLKGIHLYDYNAFPLGARDLLNLQPVPPNIQFISWGFLSPTVTTYIYRVRHDPTSKSAHGERYHAVPQEKSLVYDWTAEKTLRHLFT